MSYSSDYIAYKESVEIAKNDLSFYALIMAAMRRADTRNTVLLKGAFPTVWDDLQARYDAPGGVLDSDPEPLRRKVLGEG